MTRGAWHDLSNHDTKGHMTDIALAVEQTRTEGLIGASDAAAILGMDPYRSTMDVWLELRGEGKRERPAFVQEAAEWGQALEPVVRGKYALMTGSTVAVPNRSIELASWLRCTPDGMVMATDYLGHVGVFEICGDEDPAATSARGLVQVKTASAYKLDEWLVGVPDGYEVQCRVEMAVCNLPWCDVICLVGGQKLVGPIRIHRDMILEANILRDLRAFWDSVQAGSEPLVDGSSAWAAHAAKYMTPSKVSIQADAELEGILRERAAAKRAKEEAEERVRTSNTSILLRLAAAGATKVTTPTGYATAYLSGGGVDYKGWVTEMGGDPKAPPEKFRRPARTWTIKASGEGDE